MCEYIKSFGKCCKRIFLVYKLFGVASLTVRDEVIRFMQSTASWNSKHVPSETRYKLCVEEY